MYEKYCMQCLESPLVIAYNISGDMMNEAVVRQTIGGSGIVQRLEEDKAAIMRHYADGKVAGAEKIDGALAISLDKSDDEITQTDDTAHTPYLTSGLLINVIAISSKGIYEALSLLPDEKTKAQYAAEVAYLKGDFIAVRDYFYTVSPDDSTYLCAANIAIVAAISLNDYALFEHIEQSIGRLSARAVTFSEAFAFQIPMAITAVSMSVPDMAPKWLKTGDFSCFPVETRPMLLYVRMKHLQNLGRFDDMLAQAQSVLMLCSRKNSFTLAELHLLLLCANACYLLNRIPEAKQYLEKAIRGAAPHEFTTPFAQLPPGGMMKIMEPLLMEESPLLHDVVMAQAESTVKNWRAFHERFARDHIALALTQPEYQLAVLLKEEKTYQQAADMLRMPVEKVRLAVSGIYKKLKISSRRELYRYIP